MAMAGDEWMDKLREDNDRWIFASDVVNEIFNWRDGRNSTITHEAPSQDSFDFTRQHKEYIHDFLEQNEKKLKEWVTEYDTKKLWKYDEENYLNCKRKVLKAYKPEVYAEKDFVRLCAGIAVVAIGNQTISQNKSMISDAIKELYQYIKGALKPGGTLQNSTWAED